MRCFTRRVIPLAAVIAGSLLSLGAAKAQTVLTGPITNPGNNHVYYLLSAATWAESEAVAVQMGGHLATVRNQAENDWIYNEFTNNGATNIGLWIGLNDEAVDGTYVWASGEISPYFNWGPGEPNNDGGSESYVHILWPGDVRFSQWNDLPAINNFDGVPLQGVVELDAAAVPEPGSAALLAGVAVSGLMCLVRRRKAVVQPQ